LRFTDGGVRDGATIAKIRLQTLYTSELGPNGWSRVAPGSPDAITAAS
jgi:hypothetical protein